MMRLEGWEFLKRRALAAAVWLCLEFDIDPKEIEKKLKEMDEYADRM